MAQGVDDTAGLPLAMVGEAHGVEVDRWQVNPIQHGIDLAFILVGRALVMDTGSVLIICPDVVVGGLAGEQLGDLAKVLAHSAGLIILVSIGDTVAGYAPATGAKDLDFAFVSIMKQVVGKVLHYLACFWICGGVDDRVGVHNSTLR